MTIKQWLIGDEVALDELGNAVALDGNAHETISAHCGAQIEAQIPCLACRIVCGAIQAVGPRIPRITVRMRFRVIPVHITIGPALWPNLKTHCLNSWHAERALVQAAKGLPGEKT